MDWDCSSGLNIFNVYNLCIDNEEMSHLGNIGVSSAEGRGLWAPGRWFSILLLVGCAQVSEPSWEHIYESWLIDLCMIHDDQELSYCECILQNVQNEYESLEEVFWTFSRDQVMSYNNGC